MAGTSLNPKKVKVFAEDVYNSINAARTSVVTLYNSVIDFETTNSWQGPDAFAWFVSAHTNCYNDLVRLYNEARIMYSICEDGYKQGVKSMPTTAANLITLRDNFNRIGSNISDDLTKIKSAQRI